MPFVLYIWVYDGNSGMFMYCFTICTTQDNSKLHGNTSGTKSRFENKKKTFILKRMPQKSCFQITASKIFHPDFCSE